MTPQEAIEALKMINLKSVHPFLSWEEMLEVRNFALEALEKQIPKKPQKYMYSNYNCPICGAHLAYGAGDYIVHAHPFCRECGQAIDWSEDK